MIKFIKSHFKIFVSYLEFDAKVKNIMISGFKILFVLILFSTLILSIYITYNPTYLIFDLGISLLRSFSIFLVIFIINAISFNTILNLKNIK